MAKSLRSFAPNELSCYIGICQGKTGKRRAPVDGGIDGDGRRDDRVSFRIFAASRNAARTFKSRGLHIDSINGACPQEELDPTMASKKTKKTKKGKR
jgi:hypothetical protein